MQLAALSRFSSDTITTRPYHQERSLNAKRSY
jgi:hypothetical protein